MSNQAFSEGKITKEEFLKDVNKICDYLKEAIRCMEVEDPGTKEYRLCQMSRKILKNLNEIILFSIFI